MLYSNQIFTKVYILGVLIRRVSNFKLPVS